MARIAKIRHGLVLLLFSALGLSGAAVAATDIFTSSGVWVAPAGVTSVTVEVWGGGGAGGGNTTTNDGGGGGGGGGYSRSTLAVTPGNNYTVTVGGGGTAAAGAAGGPGGDSWFSTNGTILAKGGAGGNPPVAGAGGTGGAGGAAGAGIGTTRLSGGNGGTGRNNNTGRGGPGGSSAGTAANGTSGPAVWSTATAAAAPAGGGIGGNGGNANGQNGFAPASGEGGGGGGAAERTAANRSGGNGAGGKVSITYTPPPTVTSIDCVGSCTTNAASVSWLVTFSTSVTGGSSSNFTLVNSGLGGTPAITSVTGSGATRTVTASTGTGSGTLGLNMANTTGISPAIVGLPFVGQVFTVDRTSPIVSSIVRADPSPTALTSVSWTVTFSKNVTGVGTADFALAQAGGVSGATVTSVTPVNGMVYTVTAGTGTGNGTLGLNLVDDDSIADTVTNPLGGAGAGNGNFTGEIYTVSKPLSVTASPAACVDNAAIGTQTWGTLTGPLLSDDSYASASVNDNQTTHYLVCTGYGFAIPASATITGITVNVERKANGTLVRDAAMRIVKGGTIGATDLSTATQYTTGDTVEAHGGAGQLWGETWTPADINAANFGAAFAAIKAGTAGGARTVTVDHMSITVDYTVPADSILSIDRADADPAYAATVSWTVTFSTNVSGLSAANFTLVNGGLGGAPAITAVTGGPSVWTVTASTGVGAGTLGLNMTSTAGTTPSINGVPFAGQVYSVRPPGSVTASPTLCVDDAGIGTQTWGTLTGPLLSDNGYASASVNDNQTTHFLKCTGYGFAIPTGATITGITVNVERKANNTLVQDAAMRIVKGGAIGATDLSTATQYPNVDTVEAHGGAGQLWGETWTPADINAASFGAAFASIKAGTAGNARTVTVDHMPITVSFEFPAAPVAPDSFNAVEVSAGISGRIFTKLRGAGFALDIVAIQGGVLYGAFADTVQVDLMANAAATTCAGGTPIAGTSQNVNLASGRGTTAAFGVATAYSNVRVRIQYPSASLTRCSSDNFSIKPTAFTITSINATNLTTGAGATIKTGASFNLTAAGGAGYAGTPATNFTGNVKGTSTAGTLGGNFAAAVGGTASGTFFYGEVGHFGLLADAVRDTSFTAVDLAGTDCVASSTSDLLSGGQYGCWVGSNAVAPVSGLGFGRFIPDNFNVAYTTPPIFGTVCGTFTYVGTRFTFPTAVMTVTARAGTANGLGNATTVNYAGSYAKLTTATLNQPPYHTKAARYTRHAALNPSPTPALDHAGLPDTATDPTVGAFSGGVGTLTFSSGTGLAFVRDPAAPSAQFSADIALALNVVDEDGVAFGGNPASFGAATSGGGISFSGGKTMRYGRLRLVSANGSQLLPLAMPIEAQYWNGPSSSFIANVDDNCTSLGTASVGLGNYTSSLNAGETTATIAAGAFSKGRKMLTLSAPGTTNSGGVDVVLNLGTSTTIDSCVTWSPTTPAPAAGNLTHLRGQWCGATHTKDPTARARFGAFRGSEEVIHHREVTP